MSTDTVILALIGIGIIVTLGMVLVQMKGSAASAAAAVQPTREVIVDRYPGWWPGYGPYYSHVPVRYLVE